MIHLCTLFDKNYLDRGIALWRSLQRHVKDFTLYILALDDDTLRYFNQQSDSIIVIPLSEIESEDLQSVKRNRTQQEYCWTLTPAWTYWVMCRYKPDALAYIDADSYFFNDPRLLYDEVRNANANIAIIPHRFPFGKDKSQNGIYNVNWVYFRNTVMALECLRQWNLNCTQWCFARNEKGKFGDQKYLDEWTEKYGAYVVQNVGANLAPWNQERYFYEYDNRLYVIDADSRVDYGDNSLIRRIDALIFYHFHEWQGISKRGNYHLASEIERYVYAPYELEMEQIRKELAHGK